MRDNAGTKNPNYKGAFASSKKTCSKCKQILPLSCFSPSKGSRTGYRSKCRDCTNADNSEKYDAICPLCSKVRQLGKPAYQRFLKAPWVCKKCYTKAQKAKFMELSKRCEGCNAWFVPTGRFANSTKCKDCRRKKPKAIKKCVICEEAFAGRSDKLACSSKCQYRMQMDRKYFGGKLRTAVGWETKQCQACGRVPKKFVQIHHVFGHPDHDYLVALCGGCHKMISEIAWRKYSLETLQKIVAFGLMQRDGRQGGLIEVRISLIKTEAPSVEA